MKWLLKFSMNIRLLIYSSFASILLFLYYNIFYNMTQFVPELFLNKVDFNKRRIIWMSHNILIWKRRKQKLVKRWNVLYVERYILKETVERISTGWNLRDQAILSLLKYSESFNKFSCSGNLFLGFARTSFKLLQLSPSCLHFAKHYPGQRLLGITL